MRGLILWQHLFWFFDHPEIYIVALLLPFLAFLSFLIAIPIGTGSTTGTVAGQTPAVTVP